MPAMAALLGLVVGTGRTVDVRGAEAAITSQGQDSTEAARNAIRHSDRAELVTGIQYIVDMNRNGLDDYDDFRTGVDFDVNHNGIADSGECNLDMAWSTKHGRLGPDSFAERDRHFRIRYERSDTITVSYAVTKPDIRVHIAVLKGPDQILSLWDGMKARGVYQIHYVPKETDGTPKYRGLEVITAIIDGTAYTQPLAWMWK